MRIRIEIDELVLHGFNYHDHGRISAAIKGELARLIRENGLPQGMNVAKEIPQIDAGSFNLSDRTSPKAVGAQVARSIYRRWNLAQAKNER
jgi:hypothetical protein